MSILNTTERKIFAAGIALMIASVAIGLMYPAGWGGIFGGIVLCGSTVGHLAE